ncbi:MAG: stage III sporulation protein AB [Limnochordaceae bacterium]|nr:stage III sporulation protein AB [Limnochordaceae bacterium]
MGLLRAQALARRVEELIQLRRALRVIEAAVQHLALPAPQAFERAARATSGCVRTSLAGAAARLRSGPGQPAGEAWLRAMESVADRCHLQPEELGIFRELCLHFGRVDAGMQVELLRDGVARLDGVIEQARQEKERLERLYRFSGLAIGLALAVMLL